jgi:hypothetical protein
MQCGDRRLLALVGSDRFAELRAGGEHRHTIHYVDYWNDLEFKPCQELRDPIHQTGLVLGFYLAKASRIDFPSSWFCWAVPLARVFQFNRYFAM